MCIGARSLSLVTRVGATLVLSRALYVLRPPDRADRRPGMPRVRLVICTMTLLLCACSDLALDPSSLDGTYRGIFTITHGNGLVETGSVTFIFSGDRYSCMPEKQYLPPSGAGCFQLIGRTMKLMDTVAHTAEFDWTLILNGAFSFTYDGVHLVLVQQDEQHQRHRFIELARQ